MRRCGGFTLIELIIVIVLLAVVSTISVRFVVLSTQGSIDTSARQQRALASAVISEQISRALREAMPQSVRTVTLGGNECLEWMPILSASNYLSLPVTEAGSQFEIVPLADAAVNSGRIVVYPYPSTIDLYDSATPSPGNISLIADIDDTTVDFAPGTHQFLQSSPRKRFFVVGDPIALCPAGSFLHRYGNYGIDENGPDSSDPRQVLAANLVPGSVSFEFTNANVSRSAVVAFSFEIADPQSDETLKISQEVQIRNVP